MLQRLQRRLQGEREAGFTLIELMVVVLIIAILIAIAIPTFLGARARAQDRAAQSSLRNALTAEKTYYTDNQAYVATAGAPELKAIEPSLTFDAAANAAPTVGSVAYGLSATGAITLGTKSASGTCFYLRDTPTGATAGTTYGTFTPAGAAACTAPNTAAVALPKW